jgi:uncharacterized membrane-anchored protein
MTRIVNGTKMPRGTAAEIERLQELSQTSMTYPDIAIAMNRSLASVIMKVQNYRSVLQIPARNSGRHVGWRQKQ